MKNYRQKAENLGIIRGLHKYLSILRLHTQLAACGADVFTFSKVLQIHIDAPYCRNVFPVGECSFSIQLCCI